LLRGPSSDRLGPRLIERRQMSSKIQTKLNDLEYEINDILANLERANILLAMVNEWKADGDYVYERDLIAEKIDNYFSKIGFNNH
jgi:hypothetical protein